MLARERALLHCLLDAGRPVSKLELVKWLFLVREESNVPTMIPFYDFVPHQYGPFSFVLYHELARLVDSGLIVETRKGMCLAPGGSGAEHAIGLQSSVCRSLDRVVRQYQGCSREALIDHVYTNYPWYASRSQLRRHGDEGQAQLAVYTVGYEGRSLDAVLDLLLRKGIRQMLDVRKNAYSMKYGFGRGVLESATERCGIAYRHMSELGIPSALRSGIESRQDYEALFRHYEREILPAQESCVGRADVLLHKKPSALLCFEADPSICHRSRLARLLAGRNSLEVVHL
jgi:uncharacterized protein (DUF488 family)